MFETGMKYVLCPHSTFFNFAEILLLMMLFTLLRDSLEEHLSILLVTFSDESVTAALQLYRITAWGNKQ